MTEKQKKAVKRILRNVRRWVLKISMEEGFGGSGGWGHDSAFEISEKLKQAGFKPQMVSIEATTDVGMPIPENGPPLEKEMAYHGFVMLEDYILDVTADQFFFPETGKTPPAIFLKQINSLMEDEQQWWWGWPPENCEVFNFYADGGKCFASINDFLSQSVPGEALEIENAHNTCKKEQ